MKNRNLRKKTFNKTVLIVTSFGLLSLTQNNTGLTYALVSLGATGLCVAPALPILKRMNEEINGESKNKTKELTLTMDKRED